MRIGSDDWYDLGIAGGDNDISVAFALGYMLRVVKRSDGRGYNTEAVSVSGVENVGFCRERDAAQMQLVGWVARKASEFRN